MSDALVVSNILLWVLVLVLGVVIVALTRQIGLLHERIAPVGALMQAQGPMVGEPAPEVEAIDLDGFRVKVGGAGPRTLVFFLSPTCPVCDALLPTLQKVVRDETNKVQLLLASDGETPEVHRAFVESRGLADVPYLVSTELGLAYQVAKLPTAVLIDERGIVRSRGLVNSREHLESLFVADYAGVATIQEHLAQREREREREAKGKGKGKGKKPVKDGDAEGTVISLHKLSLRKEKPE